MRKIYFAVISIILLNIFAVKAQEFKHCGTDAVERQMIKDHPEILDTDRQLEEYTRNYAQNNAARRTRNANGTTSTLYIIPVVFHVIHQYGPENISDAQIIDAVNVLNRDFRKLNSDTSSIIPDFQSVAADCEFEFRLATIDLNGNCTNGIERIVSFRTNIGGDAAKFNPWPRNKYLNIWTVAHFDSSHASAGAYSYRPSVSLNPSVDGIISLSNYVGSIGTSNPQRSRTLTHEMGHVLNLLHTWGMGNTPGLACGDDGVSDTPVTKGFYGPPCPNPPYDICTPGINENFQNYLDYSYCTCMFTWGQKTRMEAALTSSVAQRDDLWTTANLIATGTDGSPAQLCAPVSDFFVSEEHICAGDSVQFFSAGFNTDTMTYSWSFPSGNPSTSTLQNPFVTYSTPGTYDASLTVTNAAGTDSSTRTGLVNVSGPATLAPDYFDDFETAGTFPGTDGYIINDGGTTWQRITTTGYSGTACIKMPNYNTSQAGLVDNWITPPIDLSNYNNTQLTFRMAYARKNTFWSDRLRVYVSSDCGKTWFLRKNLVGSQLSTSPDAAGAFVPTSQSQWALISITSMPQINGQASARIKFEFTSDGNNNLYIDDINITADPTGIRETSSSPVNLSVYPNPAGDVFSVSFEMPSAGNVEVNITDMLGREVKTVVNDRLGAGIHEYNISSSEFGKGIYFVRLKTGAISTVQKLMID